MATAIQNAIQRYNDFLARDKYADPTTINWFLVNNPLTMIVIIVSYLYFCLKCGPKWMEKREPFELRKTIIIYNILQILFSAYMALKGTAVWMTFNFWCALAEYDSPERQMHVYMCWLYFFAKITELMDTVLFVLRKKNNQITLLHMFHHTLMPTASWFGMRYIAAGHGTLFGVINSYVHIVMYSYYLIAALGPEYRKYLWWKRHLTEMQLIQFVIVFVHNLVPLLSPSCTYSKTLHVSELIFCSIFIYLFGDFYTKTYLSKKKNEVKKD